MRAILALAFLIAGLKGALPEVKYQDQLGGNGERSTASALDYNSQTAPDANPRQSVLALLQAPADAPHRQGEDAAFLPQASPPAGSDVDAAQAPPDSTDTLCEALLASALRNDLPVTFFANLIWQESGFQHDAVSSAGAQGIAQFMPEVAMEVGLGDPFNPHEAIPASAKLLHSLREQFGNLGFAAAAYNAGPHRVSDWLQHGRTLPRETQVYVMRVTGRSVEAWRKSPQNDSQVTFVRLLPCRGLPAFADVEQAQQREAQDTDRDQPSPQGEPAAGEAQTAKASITRQPARMFRPGLAARRLNIDQHLPVTNRAASADHMARSVRAEKVEVGHRPHITREKRRVA